MHKRLMILFCALVMIAVAMPAFAAVQNVKVSGDITANYINRDNFDLTKSTRTGGASVEAPDHINNYLSQVRIRIDADLTDNVQTTIRLINERTWGNVDDNATSTDIDLDLAYVTMKEMLYSPLTVTLGRQELHFGNDMIVGDSTTNRTANYTEAAGFGGVNGDLSLRKSFDAIRATLNYDPLVIDLVYAVVERNTATGSANDGVSLAGINAGYKFSDKWNSMVEGYVWSKIDSNVTNAGTKKSDKVYVLGVRGSVNPTSKINLQQEIAWQGGIKNGATTGTSVAQRDRNAWALQTMATVTPGWKYNPIMGIVYSYFTGDKNPGATTSNGTYRAWDPMFENQTAGHIINALYGQTNCHDIDIWAKATPMEDVTVKADLVYLTLAKTMVAGVTSANDYGTLNFEGGKKRDLGHELDITTTYDYTEDVQFGLLTGWYFPGTGIVKGTSDANPAGSSTREMASEVIGSCKVSF